MEARKVVTAAANWTGSLGAICFAVGTMFGFVLFGLAFGFSDGVMVSFDVLTAAVPFVLLFVIQFTSKRQSDAVHLKLNEIIRAGKKADNKVIAVEECPDEEAKALKEKYTEMAEVAAREANADSAS